MPATANRSAASSPPAQLSRLRRTRRALARAWLIGQKIRDKLFPAAPAASANAPALARAPNSLVGLVVVVTGASRGIGAALAEAYAHAGASVVLAARSQRDLAAVHGKIEARGGRALAVAADLTTDVGVRAVIDGAIGRFGAIDVLVNNAGTSGAADRPAHELSVEEWTAVWRLNVEAVIRCTRAATLAARAAQQPLRVINVSSGIVGHGAPRLGPYAISKDALEGLTRAWSIDDDSGLISLCSIQPRSVRSTLTRAYYDRTSFALLDEPAAIAPVFLWAATAPAAAVNGRCFAEPAFAADAEAATSVQGRLQASAPIGILPTTYAEPALLELPGAYMHLLENARGGYPSVAQALSQAGAERSLYAYPDPQYKALKAAIAHDAGTSPDHVAVAAGSSELIDRLLRMFCAAGDSIVITKPSWSFFHAFAQRWQLLPTHVPMLGSMAAGDMRHDLEGLLAAMTPRTRLVYLVNPCNPTGSMLDPRALESFVQRLPGHVVAVIDEAYLQYADAERRPALTALVDSTAARLILLRTFSKFFGLGGLRLGYAVASASTVRLLSRAEIPFAVSAPAVIAAQAALADAPFRRTVFDANRLGRQQLQDGLAALGLDAQPSQTNFVLFHAPTDPQAIRDDLKREGLVLPQVDQFLQNYAMLAVGRTEHNAQILAYLGRH